MANYPSSISTNANLYIAVNGLQTTLASPITNSVTTIPLTSTSGFPTTGYVTIENNEVVSYTGISGANLTGCTRGADGTTALAHSTGVTVGLTIVAAHHNLLKDEIIALETALGVNLANVFPATATTGSGSVVLATSPTLVTPNLGTPSTLVLTNATGLPLTTGVTGVLPNANTTATPNATASTIMSRDASVNVKVNEMIENFTTTVTAAGTTTLTVTSSPLQQFTGTTTQTVTLPDATTLAVGFYFTILNRSTGAVTVNKNGGTLQATVPASSQSTFVCTSTGSAAGTWDTSTSSAGGITAYREDYVVGTALNNYTGSTTVFNLVTPYSVGGHSLVVTVDGDIQTLGTTIDYQETNSTTVTFNNALVSTQKVSFIFQTATSSGGTVNSGTSGQFAYYSATGPTLSGSAVLSDNGTAIVCTEVFRGPVGSASAPTYSFTGHTNTGLYQVSDTAVITANGTIAAQFTSTGGQVLLGTTTNDNAAAGNIGQFVSSLITAATSFTTSGNFSDLTSISLTAGDWDVSLGAWFNLNGSTTSLVIYGISTSSGNAFADANDGDNNLKLPAVMSNGTASAFIAPFRMSLATTTTVYFKFRADYTVATPLARGRISARRVR